jgi:hypothetical protein
MQKGQQISGSARQKLQDDALGQKDQRRRPHTEEHKRKISVALVGHKHSQATKQKMRAAAQGRKHSLAYQENPYSQREKLAIGEACILTPESP